MDNRVKEFMKGLPIFLWAFFTVIAGAFSMNASGVGIFAGFVSIVGTGIAIYKLYKRKEE